MNVVQNLQRFLIKYGFRCINEQKLEENSLHDDPGLLPFPFSFSVSIIYIDIVQPVHITCTLYTCHEVCIHTCTFMCMHCSLDVDYCSHCMYCDCVCLYYRDSWLCGELELASRTKRLRPTSICCMYMYIA